MGAASVSLGKQSQYFEIGQNSHAQSPAAQGNCSFQALSPPQVTAHFFVTAVTRSYCVGIVGTFRWWHECFLGHKPEA